MTFMNALRAQLALAIRSRGAGFGLVVCVLPWAFTVGITELARMDAGLREIGPDLLIGPGAGMVLLAIGTVWGVVAWRDEPPRTRFYHWSMPIDVAVHDLARVTAFLLWFLAGLALYLLVGLLVMSGYDVPLRAVGWMPWVAPYAVGIIGYLLGVAFATAFERPVEYVLGVIILSSALWLVAVAYQLEWLLAGLRQVFFGRYGLITAAAHHGVAGMSLYVSPGARTEHLSLAVPIPLWLTMGIVAVLAAAYYDRRTA